MSESYSVITPTPMKSSTSSILLKRPTSLDLKCKSTPRNPKCTFLSSNRKCLYHGNSSKRYSERKKNIFVRLTSLRKNRAGQGVITSVALKATRVTRSNSCDLEAENNKEQFDNKDHGVKKVASEAVAMANAANVKLPTPVANNAGTCFMFTLYLSHLRVT